MSANFEQSGAEEALTIEASETGPVAPVTAQLMVTVGASSAETADRAFVAALRRASLLRDLQEGELSRLLARTTARTEFARQLDLLELYFGGGDDAVRIRRMVADRFLVHHAASGENAHAIVRRIATIVPELGRPTLERIGTDDGPLVLRAGEHVCAVNDDEEDLASSDEVDLSELEEGNVTVRALVHAANVLLKRHEIPRRWVLLRCDGRREAYCGLDADAALELCALGYLEERSSTRLLEFCSF